MSTATETRSGPKARPADSRGLLDPLRRRILLDLIAKGLSRRSAAAYVGCHAATIGRTAARDPEFAHQLAMAEEAISLDALECLNSAIRNQKSWRAAAWLLQRTQPERFATRKAPAAAGRETGPLLNQVLDAINGCVSAELMRDIEARLRPIIADAEEENPEAAEPPLSDAPADSSEPPADAPAATSKPATTCRPAAAGPTEEPKPTPPRNTPPVSSNKAPSSQPAAEQAVTSPRSRRKRATKREGVARQLSQGPLPDPRDVAAAILGTLLNNGHKPAK